MIFLTLVILRAYAFQMLKRSNEEMNVKYTLPVTEQVLHNSVCKNAFGSVSVKTLLSACKMNKPCLRDPVMFLPPWTGTKTHIPALLPQ